MLWNFFLIAIFILLQKNAFGQKKFKFHAQVQKCHFEKTELFFCGLKTHTSSVAIVHHEIKKMTKEKKYLSHLEIQKEEGSEN